MKIIYSQYDYDCSAVAWQNNSQTNFMNEFKSKDGSQAIWLRINKYRKHWRMEFCHELGHLYLSKIFDSNKYHSDMRYRFKIELMAMRLGKSICKDKYWNEDHALSGLYGYLNSETGKINLLKFRKNGIIPLNRGISLT